MSQSQKIDYSIFQIAESVEMGETLVTLWNTAVFRKSAFNAAVL